MPKTSKTVTLYLADWQKRMIKDLATKSDLKKISLSKLTYVTIRIDDRRQWVMYRQPIDLITGKSWNLYLTDEQINIVKAKTGLDIAISALNVSPELTKSGAILFG